MGSCPPVAVCIIGTQLQQTLGSQVFIPAFDHPTPHKRPVLAATSTPSSLLGSKSWLHTPCTSAAKTVALVPGQSEPTGDSQNQLGCSLWLSPSYWLAVASVVLASGIPTPPSSGEPWGSDMGGERVLFLKTSLAPTEASAGAPAMFSCCTRTRSQCCLLFLPEAEPLLYFLELLIVNLRVLRKAKYIFLL